MRMRNPWLTIPGVQRGERTLEEQMLGLEPALLVSAGKSVIDFGCAEGLIGLEFVKAGALRLDGFDLRPEFLACAKQQADAGGVADRCQFHEYNLASLCEADRPGSPLPEHGADIVLALAIVHKLRNPGMALRHMAGFARERVVIRLPKGSSGVIRCKFDPRKQCDTDEVMPEAGFRLDQVCDGPRGELVQHWVR